MEAAWSTSRTPGHPEQQPPAPTAQAAHGHSALLARNLRRLRDERHLSLSQVAKSAGLSKGTLSALEAGTGNPTMATLAELALALDASPSDLLARPQGDAVRVQRADDTAAIPGPVVSVQFLDRVAQGGDLAELYRMQIPHTAQPQHSPGHPGVEHVLVQTGRIIIGPEGREAEVGPGDYITFDGAAPHSYWAPDGPAHVTYLLTYHHSVRASRPH